MSIPNRTLVAAEDGTMELRRVITGLAVIAALACSGFSHAQQRNVEYEIGPGDRLRINVYQNPDLTLETRVTENGTITFPLIGEVNVGGKTVGAAELTIALALKSGGFIKQPYVTVVPLEIHSNQVSVLGQVRDPGRHPLETVGTRLSEAIAIAGGISETGADVAILTGQRNGKYVRAEIDIPAIFLDEGQQRDPLVFAGDVIYVHRMPRYYIYGEVQNPGSYRVERGMTIRQALAEGGGPTERGTERRLSLYRRGPNGVVKTNADLDSLIQPDDVLNVGESLF